MDKSDWGKIKSLFEAASGLEGEEREKFLDKFVGDDPEVLSEVRKLLASSDEADTAFLEEPASANLDSVFDEGETKAINNKTTGEVSTANFVAGTVLDNRYRIIGLLGKGGMGEVYKAEDLTLGQTVALKFLPDRLSKNEDALRRFVGEVKTARQVSHENVCRVFDIGEIDGNRYLSMEFIEGDDLSQLLNRIGRLPSDKAIEISRQICMGLNAIHKLGILHRDLKPANIIIDSNGKARITDFGIAGFEADVQGAESKVGTPAYMSPEQITGKEVTQRSDIYSLGLLLYEIFTGKQAVHADSLEKLIDIHKSETPTNPSKFVENIDPLVEKIIERCLEKNPANRPTSAVQVALALPGGNPLEVALEAGETPTPEMIAAAPAIGALKPLIALGLLLGFIGGFSLLMYWSSNYRPSSNIPLEDSPEVLARKAQTIINNLGFTEPPIDHHYRFYYDSSYLEYAKEQKNPREAWEKVKSGQPLVYYFRYRQSPKYLTPTNLYDHISENNPPLMEPGMINLELDTKGRLTKFTAVPGLDIQTTENPQKTDWKKLFDEAGLDMANFKEIEAKQRPTVFADEITGWEGTLADSPDIPIRIEAAGYQGKPVYFNIIPTWKDSRSMTQQKIEESSQSSVLIVFYSLLFLALFGSFLLARYNLKNGRGDLKGATKITVFFSVTMSLRFALGHYGNTSVPTVGDKLGLFFEIAGFVLMYSFFIFVAYLAIEPFFRRRLSDLFISWNRLLTGDFRNPMIGRDILVGIFLSVVYYIISVGLNIIKSFINAKWINDYFFNESTSQLNGLTESLSFISGNLSGAIVYVFFFTFFIFIFSLIFKKKWKSILAMVLLFGSLISFSAFFQFGWLVTFTVIIYFSIIFFVLFRFGLLAFLFMFFMSGMIDSTVITFDTSSFYFPSAVLIMAIMFGIAIYAYYISIAGQPIFGKNFLKEIEN